MENTLTLHFMICHSKKCQNPLPLLHGHSASSYFSHAIMHCPAIKAPLNMLPSKYYKLVNPANQNKIQGKAAPSSYNKMTTEIANSRSCMTPPKCQLAITTLHGSPAKQPGGWIQLAKHGRVQTNNLGFCHAVLECSKATAGNKASLQQLACYQAESITSYLPY